MEQKLSEIPATMLIPLWAKAAESRSTNPIIHDEKAVEIVEELDYDFDKFTDSRLTQLGVAVRTMLFDKVVEEFVRAAPGCRIINLGAGLDTRRSRFVGQDIFWYELDLPESLTLRRQFFDEDDNHRFLSCSMFDTSWMERVEKDRPILILAEGLFMYFTEEQLKPFFIQLCEAFPGAKLAFEVLAPVMFGRAKRHEAVKKMDSVPEFRWALRSVQDVEKWDSRLQGLDDWDYYDFQKKRWGWFGLLGRLLRPRLSNRIITMQINHG